MQPGLMKGLRFSFPLLCISASFCFTCAEFFLCFQSPDGVIAAPELPHLHSTVWPCSETSYQFLSLLPFWGRDFSIDPFVSGCHYCPVSCGCWARPLFIIVDPEDPPLWFEMLPIEMEGSQVDTALGFIVVARNFSTVLKRDCDRGHLTLFLQYLGDAVTLSSWSMKLAVGFFKMCFINGHSTLVPAWQEFFFINNY